MIPEIKICTKCKIEKPKDEFRVRTKKDKKTTYYYVNSWCKLCEKVATKLRVYSESQIARKRDYLLKYRNGDKRESLLLEKRIHSKKRRLNDPEYWKRWRDKNRSHVAKRSTEKSKISRQKLPDYYIVGFLVQQTKLSTAQIRTEPELIKLTRTLIQLKRKIKDEQTNEFSGLS